MNSTESILDPLLSTSMMFRTNALVKGPLGDLGVSNNYGNLDFPLYRRRPQMTIGFVDAYRQLRFLEEGGATEYSLNVHSQRTRWEPIISRLGRLDNVKGISGPRTMEELCEFSHIDEVYIGDDFVSFDATKIPSLKYLHTTQVIPDESVDALRSLEVLSINLGAQKKFDFARI